MRKLATFAAVGALAFGGATIAPSQAEAHDRRGAAVAAGIVGLAAGAIIAGSAADAYGYPASGYGYPASYGYGYGYAEPVHYYKPRRAVRVIVKRPYYYGPAYHYGWERPVYPRWKKAKWRHGHWRHGHGHHRHWDRPRCWLPERHLCY